jgi:hypothetical protein
VLVLGSSAHANTIAFGAAVNGTSCSTAGNASDRSCTSAATINNGALDTTASAQIVGQSSADHGITTNPTAVVDMTVSYTIPYTVTRTVTVIPFGPGIATLSIPTQQITLNLNYSGEVAKDNSQATGGLGQALKTGATVTSAAFGGVVLGGTTTQTGGGGLARSPFNHATPDLSGVLGRNVAGPGAGEISFGFQIPTNYQDWDDFVAPYALDYSVGGTFQQSFTDTLTISFRLRAESRPSGSISVTGGEALACAGQSSPLDGFDLDNSAACGSGLTISASVAQTGTTVEPVPEPTTLVMLGLGLAGVAAYGTRRRAA